MDIEKYVANMNEHPELAVLFKEMEDGITMGEQELEFMKKQMENRLEELIKAKKGCWDRIENVLVEKKLIEPEHKGDDFSLSYSDKTGQIFLHKRDKESLTSMIKALRGILQP